MGSSLILEYQVGILSQRIVTTLRLFSNIIKLLLRNVASLCTLFGVHESIPIMFWRGSLYIYLRIVWRWASTLPLTTESSFYSYLEKGNLLLSLSLVFNNFQLYFKILFFPCSCNFHACLKDWCLRSLYSSYLLPRFFHSH